MTAGGHGDRKVTQQGCGHRGVKPLPEPRNQGRKGTREKYPSFSLLPPSYFLPLSSISQTSAAFSHLPRGACFYVENPGQNYQPHTLPTSGRILSFSGSLGFCVAGVGTAQRDSLSTEVAWRPPTHLIFLILLVESSGIPERPCVLTGTPESIE